MLGLHPRPAALTQALDGARLALQNDDQLSASGHAAYVAERQPWRAGLWETAGRAALAGGDPAAAVAYLQNAQAHARITSAGLLALGNAYFQTGRTAEAVASWQAASQAKPPVAPMEIHTRLLDVHRAQGDYGAAIQDLKAIAALEPNAQISYQLGLMLASREPEIALAYLVQAVELDETLADTVRVLQQHLSPSSLTEDPAYNLVNAGRALALMGEWTLAAEAFYQAVLISPGYAEAWAFLGEAYQQLGQDGEAALEQALELSPDSFVVNTLLGLYWKRQGDPELALVYLYAAATLEPGNPSTEAEIGHTLDMLGDIPAALKHYQRAVAFAPEEAAYWHLLARYAMERNMQVESIGLHAARQALLLDADDPIALDLIGYGYYLLNDMVTAERFLQQALQKDPDYAPAHLHLGLLRIQQGNMLAAQDEILKAVQLAPDTPTATQAERILQQFFP